jgi:O-antigen/teichoic acid export membrane protein
VSEERRTLLASGLGLGVARALTVGLELAIGAYLMRRLGPTPFGLVAMATSLMTVFGAVGDGGVGSSLVSDRALTSQRTGAAVAVAGLLGLGVAALAALSTPLVVAFYREPDLGLVWLANAAMLPLYALQSVPRALAQREERFALLAWFPALVGLTSGAAGVALAQTRQDHWPIMARIAIGGALSVAGMWLAVRPTLARPGREDLREVWRFGIGVLGFELLNVLNRNADKVIIGRALGERSLGLYGLAYRVLSIPLTSLGGVVSTVSYPRLSALLPDLQAVAVELSETMRLVARLSTPLCLGVALAAPELIHVLVGGLWAEARVPFQALALLAVYQTPFAQLGQAYLVSRKTGLMARWGLLATPLLVSSFFIGLPWGIDGVAIAYATVSLALSFPLVSAAAQALECRRWTLARGALLGIGEGVVASLPLLGAYALAHRLEAPPAGALAAVIGVGAVVEGALLWSLRGRKA